MLTISLDFAICFRTLMNCLYSTETKNQVQNSYAKSFANFLIRDAQSGIFRKGIMDCFKCPEIMHVVYALNMA